MKDRRESADHKACEERMLGRIALFLLGASWVLALDIGFQLSEVL